MANPFVGEIRLFGGNFAPLGWLLCQGQQLAISEYSVLFNLIGTTYGGDGQQTFNLPNLAGRVPVHQGQLSEGGNYVLGQAAGTEQVTLAGNQVASHNHAALCAATTGTGGSPAGSVLAGSGSAPLYTAGAATGAMNPASITPAGGGQPHENRPPYLALNFIIAYAGIFPSQN